MVAYQGERLTIAAAKELAKSTLGESGSARFIPWYYAEKVKVPTYQVGLKQGKDFLILGESCLSFEAAFRAIKGEV